LIGLLLVGGLTLAALSGKKKRKGRSYSHATRKITNSKAEDFEQIVKPSRVHLGKFEEFSAGNMPDVIEVSEGDVFTICLPKEAFDARFQSFSSLPPASAEPHLAGSHFLCSWSLVSTPPHDVVSCLRIPDPKGDLTSEREDKFHFGASNRGHGCLLFHLRSSGRPGACPPDCRLEIEVIVR